MESAARNITVQPGAVAIFLRAVETQPGRGGHAHAAARGRDDYCASSLRYTPACRVAPPHPRRKRRPAAARYLPHRLRWPCLCALGSSAPHRGDDAPNTSFTRDDSFEIEMPAGETIDRSRPRTRIPTCSTVISRARQARRSDVAVRALDRPRGARILVGRRPHSCQLHLAAPSGNRAQRRAAADRAEDLNYGNMMVANSRRRVHS